MSEVAAPPGPRDAAAVAVPGWAQRAWAGVRGLYARPPSAVGTTICLVFLLVAMVGPALTPHSPTHSSATAARQPPSAAYWFGTDHLGRDVFTRVVHGARDVLGLAGLGTLLAVLAGTFLGLITGYWGGLFDEVLTRVFDSLLAIPALLLALLLLGTVGPSRDAVLIVIVLVYTPIVARVVRSVALSVKHKAFVEAARVRGEALWYILLREVFPSTLPTLAVEASLRFSYAIFLVASLSFLGLGVQPPSPNWGLMVKEARAFVSQAPWALFFPAAAISLLIIGVNLMSDGLKRVLQARE